MSLEVERSEMTLLQEFGIASLLRNGCKYFCPPTYQVGSLFNSNKRNDEGAITVVRESECASRGIRGGIPTPQHHSTASQPQPQHQATVSQQHGSTTAPQHRSTAARGTPTPPQHSSTAPRHHSTTHQAHQAHQAKEPNQQTAALAK